MVHGSSALPADRAACRGPGAGDRAHAGRGAPTPHPAEEGERSPAGRETRADGACRLGRRVRAAPKIMFNAKWAGDGGNGGDPEWATAEAGSQESGGSSENKTTSSWSVVNGESDAGDTPAWAMESPEERDGEKAREGAGEEPGWTRERPAEPEQPREAREEDALLGERPPPEQPPQMGCQLVYFKLVNFWVIATALTVLAAQVMTLVNFFSDRHGVSALHVPQCVLRFYGILLCLLAVMVELEWPVAVGDTFLGRSWICRGLFYIFLGVLALEELDEWNAPHGPGRVFVTVAGTLQAAAGIAYVTMGVLCMKFCRDRAQASHNKAIAQYEARRAWEAERQFLV